MSRTWMAVAVLGIVVTVADVLVSAFWPYPVSTVEAVMHVAVAAAWIGLRTTAGELLQTTETNQLGRFTFLGLRAGTYELAARDVRPGEMTPTRQVGVPSPTGEYDLHYA